ncbi:replication restart DNA helicase PriA [Prevotella sp. tc2-28]|uniref:replication restart helicase PriA n=1 Tax=Prevotella sp. tc2-28 TaxID=1761888 RepID=UPI00089C8F42|nr:primosomal protein N' [Prevotella sp. tc2-28]SEA59598.1 replication restart DNA helicase PriA [Prevotella sp. tc2-28]
MHYADLILPVPLQGLFTYAIPEGMSVRVGMRVLVPFGRNKTYMAIVAKVHDVKPEGYQVKPIAQVMDEEPIVTERQLQLWQWISDYYLSPIGDVYKAALPSGLKAEEGYKPKTETYIRLTAQYCNVTALHIALNVLGRAPKQLEAFTAYLELSHWDEMEDGVKPVEVTREELLNASHASAETLKQLEKRQMLETYEVEVGRLNHSGEYRPELIQLLSEAQQTAYNAILMSMMKHRVTLLHGVTSSGKTEIYIHLIKRALERKEQVLYLLPEIALTVQMMQRLQRVFGNRLGIYHSKYSDAERVEIWQKQLSKNPYDVILGARSAVLLPFQQLGLVIVDEEHETSYKQQDPAPRYHARSAAIMLAQQQGAKVVLGTATPSMESYHNAKTSKYGLVELTERYKSIELPEIQVVDIADLQHRKMMAGPFSPLLLTKVREALERGEQAILFQNRRGFAPMIECRQCGWVPRCQHCDVSLTLHRQLNQLTCHYCGYTYRVPTECPCCGSTDLRTKGYGTEKIEEQVREVFPEARVARMDLDTTRTRNAYERIITDFSAGRTNIMIGTQMISKGLDFDKVSVVGILNADTMLNYPDFRAYEHAFMMMAQVSGRAGRKGRRGLVILQTKQKDLPVIQQVVRNDYTSLYKSLAAERQAFHYPPYYHLVYVFMKHSHDDVVNTAGIEMGSRLRQWFGGRVLGPDKPSVAKVKSQNIRKLVLKLENGIDMKRVRKYLLLAQSQMLADKRYASLQIYYDADPL